MTPETRELLEMVRAVLDDLLGAGTLPPPPEPQTVDEGPPAPTSHQSVADCQRDNHWQSMGGFGQTVNTRKCLDCGRTVVVPWRGGQEV